MLPDFLFNSYKQYKADTDAVASWLASTAKKCGFPDDLLTPVTATPQQAPAQQPKPGFVPTKKQKIRMEEAAKKAQQEQQSQPKSKYVIAIKDFISLANYIAGHTKSVVTVPTTLAATLERAISARKAHQVAMKGDFGDLGNFAKESRSDKSHSYFVGILEEIQNILKPRMSVEVREATKATPSKEDSLKTFTNMFEGLSLEQPSKAFLNAPDITPEPSSMEPQYEAEPLYDFAEVLLAVHCLFIDLNRIRTFISQTWSSYRAGIVDLVSASISSNTAIDFVRRIEEEFIKAFPKYSDPEEISKIFFVGQCIIIGEDPMHRERPGDPINFKVYDVGELCFKTVHVLLASFADGLEDNTMLKMEAGFHGTYNPTGEWNDKSPREKFQDDKVVLLEALPDFVLMLRATDGENILGEDEFTRSMRPYVKTRKTTLWLTFAAQVYLDIHHVLRKYAENSFHQMQQIGKYVEASINENFKFHENLRIENWPKSNDMVMRSILEYINDWVKTDPHAKAKRMLQVPADSQSEPFLFFRRHPLLCGLITYAMKMLFSESATTFVNAWGSVMYSAHMYNAAQQEGFCSKDWTDMEMAMSFHGEDKFFVGGQPKGAEAYFRHFCLCVGYSASNFASNRRPNPRGATASQKGPRGLNNLAPVCRMFMDRFCATGRPVRTELTEADVQKILEQAVLGKDDDEPTPNTASQTKPTSKMPLADVPEKHAAKLQKQWEKYHRCTPIQLLESLRNVVHQEQLPLTFDFLRLHRICWRLLRMIKERLHEDLLKYYGPGYLEKENRLAFVVGYIFMTATSTKKLAGILAPKTNDEVTSKLLMDAAGVVDGMIETGGGELCLKVLRQYGGINVEVEA